MKQCFLTTKGPKAIGPYSTAVLSGHSVYLSGMIPVDPATGKLVEGGVEEQARRVFENIAIVLEELGLAPQSAVKATVFLTDLGDFGAVNAIYSDFFKADFPARSCVEVSRLPAGASVEVELVCEKPAV